MGLFRRKIWKQPKRRTVLSKTPTTVTSLVVKKKRDVYFTLPKVDSRFYVNRKEYLLSKTDTTPVAELVILRRKLPKFFFPSEVKKFGFRKHPKHIFPIPSVVVSITYYTQLATVTVESRKYFDVIRIVWYSAETFIKQLVRLPYGVIYRIVHESNVNPSSIDFQIQDNGSDILKSLGSGSGNFPRSILPQMDSYSPLRIPKLFSGLLSISGLTAGDSGVSFIYLLKLDSRQPSYRSY